MPVLRPDQIRLSSELTTDRALPRESEQVKQHAVLLKGRMASTRPLPGSWVSSADRPLYASVTPAKPPGAVAAGENPRKTLPDLRTPPDHPTSDTTRILLRATQGPASARTRRRELSACRVRLMIGIEVGGKASPARRSRTGPALRLPAVLAGRPSRTARSSPARAPASSRTCCSADNP